MTLKHFIERPVLASVISIVIVIAGLIGLATLGNDAGIYGAARMVLK